MSATTDTVAGRTLAGRIGDSPVRPDGIIKAQGTFAFSSDVPIDGARWGMTLRSPHPYARIVSIDVSRAWQIDGVAAVITADDVPGSPTYGLIAADQPVFAADVVRYVGEPIAAVAADHPETCRRALAAIEVTYEVLEPLLDPEAAIDGSHPPIHPDGNVLRAQRIRRGDPTITGDVVVEGTYEIGMQDQAFLGLEAAVAIPDPDGAGVELHVATQWLHEDRKQIAACLALEEERVRLVLGGVGGAFGAREDISLQVHTCLLARRVGGPVRMAYSRSESFLGHVHRHPARIWMRHHATADGRIRHHRGPVRARRRGLRVDVVGGAAERRSPTPRGRTAARTPSSRASPCAPTTCPAARCAASASCRPASPTRARWTGWPRPAGSTRSRSGCATPCGPATSSSPARSSRAWPRSPAASPRRRPCPCRRTRSAAAPTAPGSDVMRLPGGAGLTADVDHVRRGVGWGVAMKNLMYSEGFDDYSTARCVLADGVATLKFATSEVGQGFVTIAQQIARTVLGVDEVVLEPIDTAIGSAGSTSASRQTWMSGGAVDAACRAVRERLFEYVGARRRDRPAPLRRRGRRGRRLPGRLPHRRRRRLGRADVRRDRRVPPPPDRGARRGRSGRLPHRVRVRRPPRRRRRRRRARAGQGRPGGDGPGRRAGPQPAVGARPDRGRHLPGRRAGRDGGDRPDRRSHPQRQLHRLPAADVPRHARGDGDARRGARPAGPARRQRCRGAAVHLGHARRRGRHPGRAGPVRRPRRPPPPDRPHPRPPR